MTIQIQPTTALTDLVRNNTSASDSFLGWPNGVAEPGNVSNLPLGIPQQTLVHIVPWWGTTSHPTIGYNSADPVYIAKLVADLKRRGIAGATWLWNGQGGQMDLACLAMKPAFEAAGLKFAIMLSSVIPSIVNASDDAGRTKALNAAVDYLRSKFFSSPAQLRIGGRPQLFFFGFANGDFDWTAVRSHLHAMGTDEALCYFRMEQTWGTHLCADGYFGWMDHSDAWVAFAKKFGKPLVLGLNGGFNNTQRAGTVVDCIWGTPRVIDQRGGLLMQESLAQAAKYPEIPQAQIGTWNDYQEGTAVEPGLDSGSELALALDNGVLTWNDCGAAIGHYDVMVAIDGKSFMPLTRSDSPVPVDLKLMDFAPGGYQFLVHAVAKPTVQNLTSNLVSAVLGWTKQ